MNHTLLSTFFAVICFAVFGVSCSSQQPNVVDLKFTVELVRSDLDKMQEDMAAQGITLSYEFLDFDESGKLQQVSASIEYPDGQRSSFESRVLGPDDQPGFYRDFSQD